MATKFLEPDHEIYLVFLTHMEMDEPCPPLFPDLVLISG